ncbi:MAG: hypothetical protein IPK84_03665 [Candidatus Moraniibacteriota bacterium]|nr:MAG: hypothetical protein IPK84_03665 [Candidatus Moranbacteria bacterium]
MIRSVLQAEEHFIVLLSVGILAGVCLWGMASQSVFAQAIPGTAQVLGSEKQISASAILLDGKGSPVPNGEYEVRFSIYRADRTTSDPYPSDTDAPLRVWEETQTATVKNGIMNAYLGVTTPFPGNLTFEGGEYFLGVRVGTDSEMIPRKKFGTFTNAINSQFLRGRTFGTNAGDIATYGTNGKFDIKQLPTGTSGNKLLLANNKDFTGVLDDVSGLLDDVSTLQNDSHAQNTDTGTDSLTFNVGSDTAVGSSNFGFTVSSAGTKPELRYNSSLSQWEFSDDGSVFTALNAGSGGGVNGSGTSGQIAYWTGTSTLGSEAHLSASRGGTGIDTSSSTGVPVVSSGTWSIASALGVSQGGTGLSSTPANGELLIGNGSGFALATLSTGSGLALSNGAGSINLALDVTTTGTTATTQSNSGLELVASGLRLLGGCSDGEILKWDSGSSVWACSSDLGGATAIINVNEGSTAYTGIDTLTFDADDFSISQLGSEATVTIDYANSGIARLGQDETVTGAWDFSGNTTFGTIVGGVWNGTAIGATYGGTGINTSGSTGVPYITGGTWSVDATALSVAHGGTGATSLANLIALTTDTTGNYVQSITNGNGITGGNGGSEGATLTLSLNLLTSADGTGSTSSNSGLEFQGTSSNELSLLQGCANNEVLSWNDSTNVWQCASVSGVGGVTGSATSGQVAYWTGTSTLSGEDQVTVAQGGTGIGSYTTGDILYASGATTLAKLADVATGNVLISGGVGVQPQWGKVALGSAVSGTLPVANGGTGATTLTANGVIYGNGTGAIQATSAGTDAQILIANASGVPTFVTLGGDATVNNSGSLTIAANSVALTTDTTGNYVQSITNGNGITGGNGGSEGATLTLSLNLLTSADGTGSTSSNSGLEFQGTSSNELSLLQGCANNEVLSWNDSTNVWQCASVSGVGGVTGSATSGQVAYWTGTSTLSGEDQVTVAQGGTGIGSYTTGDILYASGATTLAKLADVATGNVLISGGVGVQPQWGKVALGTYTSGNYVANASTSTLTGLTGGSGGSVGASLSLAFDYTTPLTGDPALSANNAIFGTNGLIFEGATANTFETYVTLTDPTADRTLTLPNVTGTIATLNGGQIFTSATWNGTAIGATYGGTGINTIGSTGVPYINGGAWSVDSAALAVAHGGTGLTTFGGTNTLLYTTTANTLASISAAANSILVTNGSNVPSLSTDIPTAVTIGSAYIYRVGGTDVSLADGGTGSSLSDPNADRILFWDDSAGAVTWLSPSSNLSISTTTLDLASSININTLQLGTDGTDGSFIIYSEQGATDYTTTFQPGAQSQNITYTLPNDDGTSGQVLITDGTGALSWSSVSGAGGVTGTSTSGYAVYWDSTNSIAGEPYLSLTRGGTGTTLSDPGADRILFWDDSVGAIDWLSAGSNLSISGTTINLASSIQLGSDGSDGVLTIYSEQGATDYTSTFQPGTQTQNITYTLPADDGAASQVLVTDGTGNLSWQSVSGVGALDGSGLTDAVAYWVDSNTLTYETALALSRGGTGSSLSDPNADRILFWDDSAGAVTWLSPSSNLSISTTTLDLASSVNVNTLQLGTDGTDGSFIIYSEQGATDYTTTFQPGAQSQNITYTLPNDDGTSGQVLITDGSGILSWTSAGSGGIGDITAIGDVASGDAFTASGTQGTSLYFYDVDGRGQLTIANLTAARMYTLPDATGTIITTGNLTGITATGTIASGTWNGTAIGAAYGGTGLDTSGGSTTGVPTISSGVWSVSSSLDVTLGGTGTSALSSGGLLYGNGTSAIGALSVMTNGQLLIGDGTGVPTLATLSEGDGVTVTNGAGSITLSLNLLTSADGTGSTSSNSGLEFQGTSSNELSLLQGCANNEVLSWNDSTNVWQCASVSGVGGVTGSATSGQVAYWTGTSTLSGEDQVTVAQGERESEAIPPETFSMRQEPQLLPNLLMSQPEMFLSPEGWEWHRAGGRWHWVRIPRGIMLQMRARRP